MNKVSPLKTKRSEELWQKAIQLIPAGTQTFSKGPGQYANGVAPKYIQRGEGGHVWDVDGNEYIDYGMALGPIILGYAYSRVNQAIAEQLQDGITYTLMHPLEVELSELLVELSGRLEGDSARRAEALLEEWKTRSPDLKLKIYHLQQGVK